jgi:linoleoyl-CoA desaturase
MHYTAGLILSCGSVVEEKPLIRLQLGQWTILGIHQLFTTTNFAPKNAIVNWYTGGLNHQ